VQQVIECARVEGVKRKAVLFSSSSRLILAYRAYRDRLRLRGTATAGVLLLRILSLLLSVLSVPSLCCLDASVPSFCFVSLRSTHAFVVLEGWACAANVFVNRVCPWLRARGPLGLACIVLAESLTAHSDLALARLEWRMNGTLLRLPSHPVHADVVAVFLEVSCCSCCRCWRCRPLLVASAGRPPACCCDPSSAALPLELCVFKASLQREEPSCTRTFVPLYTQTLNREYAYDFESGAAGSGPVPPFATPADAAAHSAALRDRRLTQVRVGGLSWGRCVCVWGGGG
jgi:hypothetical protein